MALGHEIYDYDPSARLSVRDDRESSCTNLTELVSEKDGERPVDAARITEGQRDPRTLSRQRKSLTRSLRGNLSYTNSYLVSLYEAFKLVSIENVPILSIKLIQFSFTIELFYGTL